MISRRTLWWISALALVTGVGMTGVLFPPPTPPSARVGQAQPAEYRQGVITFWDPLTLDNRVRVDGPDGPEFENLPVLGIAESGTYDVGDVVGLLVVSDSWSIIGQFVIPGTAQAATALSFLGAFIKSATVSSFENITSTSYGDLTTAGPAVTVHIGPSGKALVILGAELICNQPAGSAFMGVEVTGASSISPDDGRVLKVGLSGPNTGIDSEVKASSVIFIDFLTPGDNTFTAKYRRTASGVGANAQAGGRNITVFPL